MGFDDRQLEERRMHPVSILFRVGGYLRQLAFPLILVLLLARGDSWEIYASLLGIPLALFEVWRHLTTTYRISQDQLVVRRGVFFRSERNIPLSRIQNLDLVQNGFHRLLKVAEVRIETASGSEPEAILKVLGLDEVERLRRLIFAKPSPSPAVGQPSDETGETTEEAPPTAEVSPAEREVELLHLPLGELVRLGFITYRGLAVVGVGIGLAWQFDLFEQVEEYFEEPNDLVDQIKGFGLAIAIAGLIVLGFFGVTLLSILWAVFTLYDYRLVRVGEDLRVSCGLWTRLTATIPRQRIQLVSLRQTLLHRLFRRVSVSVETAGGSAEAERIPINRRWLVPLIEQERLAEVLREIQPKLELLELDWQPLATLARRRMVRKSVIVALLVSVGIAFLSWVAALTLLPILLVLAVLHALAAARYMRYARSPGGIAFRSGVFTRRVSGTRLDRIQTVAQRQTPFDRRYDMATVAVDTAGAGPAGHEIKIPYLEQPVAALLRRDLVAQTAHTDFSWT